MDTIPQQPTVLADESPAPLSIVIDDTRFTIGDLRLFLRLAQLKDRPAAEQSAALMDALPTFDRLVVGGIDQYPLAALGQVMEAVAAAMNRAGNPGN